MWIKHNLTLPFSFYHISHISHISKIYLQQYFVFCNTYKKYRGVNVECIICIYFNCSQHTMFIQMIVFSLQYKGYVWRDIKTILRPQEFKNSTVPPPPFDGETVPRSPVYGFWPPINNLLI